ncbi:MAG: AraC family transcriptional regulator [Minwuiales bacterium]|nr:AraC family transcriptional regulator [Minwuiales bacterium]
MDVVSDILGTVKLRGSLYFQTALGPPFAVRVPPDRNTVRFHLMLGGDCLVSVPGLARPIALETGDFVFIPHGAAQVLSDAPDRAPRDLPDVLSEAGFTGAGVLRAGDPDAARPARLICGFCGFDDGADHPLLRSLPSHILIRAAEAMNYPWLGDAVRFIAYEAEGDNLGRSAIVDRLSEILFIQAVRAHAAKPDGGRDFFGGLADPNLSRALAAIHAEPAAPWTLERLAREAGLSRSRFAELFHARVGQPPAQYLADWRLQKARVLLTETRLSTAEIAHRVGYASLPSFSRLFKRRFGVGPGQYRREQKTAA